MVGARDTPACGGRATRSLLDRRVADPGSDRPVARRPAVGLLMRRRPDRSRSGAPSGTVVDMADLPSPRRGSQLSRRQREDRGYKLVVVGGVAAAVTVVGAVLAIVGVLGWGLPFIALIVTAVCAFLFRRLAQPR